MFKTVIAGLTALSLTMTTASMAQAQGLTEDQIGKFLFGVVATATIANMVQGSRHMPEAVEVHSPRNWGAAPQGDWPRHEQPTWQTYRMNLPADCLLTHQTRYGEMKMFGRNCLRQNYRHMASLPQYCAVRAITREGPRNGWDPQCLRANGYTTNRRH